MGGAQSGERGQAGDVHYLDRVPVCCCGVCIYRSAVCPSEEFLLEPPKNYGFLTFGNVSVSGVDDAHEFKATVDAMHIMGMNQDDLQCESAWLVVLVEL